MYTCTWTLSVNLFEAFVWLIGTVQWWLIVSIYSFLLCICFLDVIILCHFLFSTSIINQINIFFCFLCCLFPFYSWRFTIFPIPISCDSFVYYSCGSLFTHSVLDNNKFILKILCGMDWKLKWMEWSHAVNIGYNLFLAYILWNLN